jgi:chemotaxis protein methyltransferase CheR
MDADILGLPKGSDVLLADLIHERTGLYYGNGNGRVLLDKLAPLVVARGFGSFLDYYYLLKYDDTRAQEWPKVLNALSVQETYFWREIDQVKALVDTLVPNWVSTCGGKPIRIWSAACATGEEPLTIAIALEEANWFARWPCEIWASDASGAAIQKAQQGLFRERAVRNLPPQLREKYFVQEGNMWRIDADILRRVQWGGANLVEVKELAPYSGIPFVFCRNVFIYFSEEAIRRVLRTMATLMSSGGYLFVSVSESLLKRTDDFVLREIGGAFVYERLPQTEEDRE